MFGFTGLHFYLAGAALVAGFVAYATVHHQGVVEGKEEIQAKWDSEKELQRIDASRRSNQLAADAIKARAKANVQLKSVNDRLSARIGELQLRASRADDAASAARTGCAGATGAELSRPDAEFLEREAARAETQRSGLSACYDEVDSLREQIAPPKSDGS